MGEGREEVPSMGFPSPNKDSVCLKDIASPIRVISLLNKALPTSDESKIEEGEAMNVPRAMKGSE